MMHYKPLVMELIMPAKSLAVVYIFTLSTTNFFSILASVVATFYFAAMIKVNVVDKYYEGRWRNWVKGWAVWRPLKAVYNRFKK